MIACYDLRCNPPTYDVVAFLALLEIERLRRGEDYIDLHILPGPVGGFRSDGLWPRSVEERVALRGKVLVPICHMLPSVRSVEVFSGKPREVTPELGEAWGAGERKISLPAMVEAMRAGSRPLRAVDPIIEKIGGLITFTLREAEHHPLRNSRTEEWVKAAIELTYRLGFEVVVIRDAVLSKVLLDGVACDVVAPYNISHRASLYAGAVLNVGISNGPMWMALFMGVPTLMLRPCTEAAHGYNAAFFKRYGVAKGSQLPTSPSHQRLAWVDDTCENIVREVEEMLCVVG